MKFKIEITKDVIDRSLLCGTENQHGIPSHNCAFAVAYNEIVNCSVGYTQVLFFEEGTDKNKFEYIGRKSLTEEQKDFILEFDRLRANPKLRYSLVGRVFEVEIPDEVLDQLYESHVEVANKIANSEVLTLI